jgi:hypothetical protein
MECKQTAELNQIHKMTTDQLTEERDGLRAALRGALTIEERTHKTSRLQLVERYIGIRTADKMAPQKFKAAQELLGLTNQAMADLMCCSVAYVEMLRGGKRKPSWAIWRIIEQAEELQRLKAT